jgi:hypothetical protein
VILECRDRWWELQVEMLLGEAEGKKVAADKSKGKERRQQIKSKESRMIDKINFYKKKIN